MIPRSFRGTWKELPGNLRRRRKLIKPSGILGEVDARPFPMSIRNGQLINFLCDHSRFYVGGQREVDVCESCLRVYAHFTD